MKHELVHRYTCEGCGETVYSAADRGGRGMKLIIAGSRDITLTCACRAVEGALEKTGWCHAITEVVSGASGNVDKIGEFWAELMELPIKRFPADWDKHGKAAGPIRNRAMAEYADALLAVWDGESKGTRT